MNYKKITSLILSVAIISSTHSYCIVKAAQISNTQNNSNQSLNNYNQSDINVPADGTPFITNVANNSIYNSSVEPIIKINNISLNVSDIGENKAVHATLNGQPYKLTFISKKNNILTLKGSKISQNTMKGQKNTLIIYSKKLNSNGTTSKKTASVNFSIDSEPPSISFSEKNGINIQDGGYYTGQINPVIKLSDNYNISNYSININGVSYTGNASYDKDGNITFEGTPISSDGNYKLSINVKDSAGNTSTFSRTFTLDNSAPNISISGINNKDCVNTDVTPKINIEDCAPDIDKTTLNVKKDGTSIPVELKKNSDGSLYFNVGDEGSYSFSVTAYDKCGHSSTSTPINFVIDKTPPSLNFNFDNDQYFNKAFKPVIKTENSSDFISTLTINGNPYLFNNLPFFSDGTYEVEAQGKDNAGNLSQMYHLKFTVDTIAPEISISGINNNDYVNTSVTPRINIKDCNTDIDRTVLTVKKDGVLIPVTLKQSLDGSLYFNVSAEGSYSFSVTAYDKSGNSSTSAPVNFVIDKTPPSLDFNFTDGQYINKDFKPIVKTKDINDFISTLLINGNPYLFNDLPYFHDGSYELEAQGKDKAGNLSAVYHLKFIVDTIAPDINISNLTDNFYYNTSVNPSISVTDTNLAYVKMLLNGSDYNLGELVNEGNYQLIIMSKDKANNFSEKTLTFVIDKTAPSISINGLTDNGFFNYFLNPYVYISDNNPLMSILLLDGHDYHGGLITEDGKHILIVEVVDKAGNVSKKVYKFFIKAAPPEVYISGIENGKTYSSAIIPKISFSKDVVDSYTSITLDGKSYNIGDEISSIGKHELIISVKDNYGNKTVKKVYFSIASSNSNTIPSKLKTIIHKIIPAKTKKSTKILYLLTGAIWIIVICVAGVIIYKFKKHKKASDSDNENI